MSKKKSSETKSKEWAFDVPNQEVMDDETRTRQFELESTEERRRLSREELAKRAVARAKQNLSLEKAEPRNRIRHGGMRGAKSTSMEVQATMALDDLRSDNSRGSEKTARGASCFWRFLAILVDGVVIVGGAWVLTLVNFITKWAIFLEGYTGEYLKVDVDVMEFFIAQIIMLLIVVIMPMVLTGQSLGKIVFGIKVINCDGTNISLIKVILREVIGKPISAGLVMIGYLMALVDPRRRALHDYIAGTLVIKNRQG